MTTTDTDTDTIPPCGPSDPAGHYAALGAAPDATPAELVSAHRAAARRWHPDRNPGRDTTREMQRVNAAAEVLLDAARRAEYDRSARRAPVVLTTTPGAANLPPTTVGNPVTTVVTVRSNEPLTDDELRDVEVSATSGPGWTATLWEGDDPLVVVIIEVTCHARVVGRVADTIVVRAAGRSAVVQVNGTVTAVAPHAGSHHATGAEDPEEARARARDREREAAWDRRYGGTTPPPPPPPPRHTPAPRGTTRWWGSTGPAWSGWATTVAWLAAIASVLLVGNSTTIYVEDGTLPVGVAQALPWLPGLVMTAGLVGLAWATRLFTRGGWVLGTLTVLFVAPALVMAAVAAVVVVVTVAVIAIALFIFALSS